MTQSTKMKKCHVCGVELREGAKVCTNCGINQLPETTLYSESTAPIGNVSSLPNTSPGVRPPQPPKRPVPPAPTPIRLSLPPTQPGSGTGTPPIPPVSSAGTPLKQPASGATSTQISNGAGASPTQPGSSTINSPSSQGPIILSPSTMQNGQSQPPAVNAGRTIKPSISIQAGAPSIDDIKNKLNTLIEGAQKGAIEQHFPGNLPNKAASLADWEKQLRRVRDCVIELQNPEYRQMNIQQKADILRHLDRAARTLDYEREYTIKLIGGTGAGKSTLLATLIGQDIFPRETGKAITAVPTHVRICDEQEEEEMSVHFFSQEEFADILTKTEERNDEPLTSEEAKAIEKYRSCLGICHR